MVYRMMIYVDGACRRNGSDNAIGAAAAVHKSRHGTRPHCWARRLEAYESPTNQQAELIAVILGLEMALDKHQQLRSNPVLDITIHSDSRYAGNEVANRGLIEAASDLDDKLQDLGDVTYTWIPRSRNTDADRHCNEVLDDMEKAKDYQ
ncbi:RNase H domain containing protein [Coccidioides posadasii C735 delta SOWgp]|uniref:RNase H domain containing protein n=1 Tax=Coccidioides posadasii (strain C735) TaxID=222929 RepID=C5P776_COCP7|nr:RNase H domain containing protein [Coccidioides posadasii C735 delta SOWgp]EER27276.1 RNase H domain containing protein [Coccidioides posadasii C735 delta SOWgp]|eukprot:XP_003069421.1 RNase H domain containing protein [Coccidioides posadasii C735 delta SOWgp]